MREKLVDILMSKPCGYSTYEEMADYLIAHGVTVQEGKPLEAFLHPIDAYKGLKAKYLVFKADTGEKVDNCFILRPDKDPVAVEAIRAYASKTDNETLAEDIYNWVGKGVMVQEWISVSERLPEKGTGNVLVVKQFRGKPYVDMGEVIGETACCYSDEYSINPREHIFTHWMPMPEPPKGE